RASPRRDGASSLLAVGDVGLEAQEPHAHHAVVVDGGGERVEAALGRPGDARAVAVELTGVARATELVRDLVVIHRTAEVRACRRERPHGAGVVAEHPSCAEANVFYLRPAVALFGDHDLDAQRDARQVLRRCDGHRIVRTGDDLASEGKGEVADQRDGQDGPDETADGHVQDFEEASTVGLRHVTAGVALAGTAPNGRGPRYALLSHPYAFSVASCSSLQRMQSVVSGRASSRFVEIGSPHSSQIPNVPASIFASAWSIFLRNVFSRPRRRNWNDCRYSLDARSISSGRSSTSRVISSLSVRRAFLRISSFFSSRIVR